MQWLTQEEFGSAFANAWRTMQEKGLALQDILTKISEFATLLDVKDSLAKARLVASLADIEHRLAVGTSEKLQLGGLVGLFLQARPGLVA